MYYAQHQQPKKPKKLPWFGRWSNTLLILLSTLFMFLGLCLVAIGAVMMALNNVLSKDEVKAIFNGMDFNGSFKIGNVLNSLPLLTICVGTVVFVLAIFACVSRGTKNRICLTLTAIFIFWFLIVQILTCAMWVIMRDKFEETVKGKLEESFEKYEGNNSTTDTSIGWDLIHIGFDCCSINVITTTSNRYTFNVTTWWTYRDSSLDNVPSSCCSDATEENYKTYSDSNCERVLLDHNKRSCYDQIVIWLRYFWKPAVIVTATLVAIEVLLVFLSCVLCCGVERAKRIK